MKSTIPFLILLLSTCLTHAQLVFNEKVVIDNSRFVQSPMGVVSGDIDGDGDKDILTSSYFGNRLLWIENLNGLGTDCVHHTISSTIQAPWGVCLADLDGDGDLDAVSTALSGNNVTWYQNTDGHGTFVLKQSIYMMLANKVMAADMDNDGDLDLVYSAANDGKMKWSKNTDGLGTFGTTINVELNVTSIPNFHPVDLNGDGFKDIVAAYAVSGGGSQGIVWYRNPNNGSGTMGSRILISNAVTNIAAVYAADIDGDGDMDVVSASDNKIAWYKNTDGQGTFGPQLVLSTTAAAPGAMTVADVDGDGDKDVVYGSNTNKTIGWFETLDGAGTFSAEKFIAPHSCDIRDIHFSDMDADGDFDFLAATNIDNNVTLYINTGNGNFTADNLSKHAEGGRIVAAEDIDGDGDKDIVAASYADDKISWFKNLDGQGNFYDTQTIVSTALDGATSVIVGDVNGDGFKDILATSYLSNSVLLFKNTDGLGNFAAAQTIDNNLYNSSRVYLADIDNDGDKDIFALGTTRIAWYKNLDGLGNFGPQQTIDNISNFTMFDMDFADLDGDGDMDIAVAGSYGMMRYLNTNGQGTFGNRLLVETNNYHAVSTKIADLDGDGDKDLIYMGTIGQTSSSTFLGWSKNTNGLGTFGSIQIISTLVATPKSLIIADFDADGDIDIASSAQGNGGVIAWYENTDGHGAFANTQQIVSQTSNSPFHIVAADMDNNNTVDIVSISNIDNKISWHKNRGIPTSNSISGTVRFDLLGDGCTDTDALLSGLLLVSTGSNSTNATFSQENGQYQIYTTEAGTVTTRVTSQLPTHYAANPSSYVSTFTGLGNSYSVNFCIAPVAPINDLSISYYPTKRLRPGFLTGYRIVYKNMGTTQLSGAVTFTFDNAKLQFVSASPAISTQTANTLSFDFANLNPFQTKIIDVHFTVFAPPTTNIGDEVINAVSISPVANDLTPDNNAYHFRQFAVGALDPNDITCLEGDQVLIQDADKYLHYLIRFQNTGTAEAVNVRVDNPLDDKLDWTTMELESLSHAGRVAIRNGSNLQFYFNNIHLPSSSADEPNSHGFIAYKIKPKNTVAVGNIVHETASIYFDFNPAVVTNTANTQFVEALNISDFEAGKVSVYPNPTSGLLHIESSKSIKTIEIYNHLGQLVLTAKESTEIDLTNLTQGIYLLTVQDTAGGTWTRKVVKK
jgi:hypothetical protein